MAKDTNATITLTGRPGASESSMPPTAASSAKHTDHATAAAGRAVMATADAPGVISSAITSSTPTIWTVWAAAMPSRMANSVASTFTRTPLAAAISGSTEANSSGRHSTITATTTSSVVEVSTPRFSLLTPTIWPVSSAIAVVELPG